MKTLFGCATATHTRRGQAALWRWWFYYRPFKDAFGATHFVAVNDGNGNMPLELFVKKQDGQRPLSEMSENALNFVYWPTSLGRTNLYTYPGYWRSLCVLLQIAREQAFERLIFVEWDFFILSESMMLEIKDTPRGIMTYWVPRYNFPEAAFIFCGKDHYATLEAACQRALKLKQAELSQGSELSIPWTEVRKHRVGDRYAEYTNVLPFDADYCGQLPIGKVIHKRQIVELCHEVCTHCGMELAFDKDGILACSKCSPTVEKAVLS